MKKYLLIGGIGLLMTAGVTATVLNNSKKKTTTKQKKECCMYKMCTRAAKAACY
jgi:hypothetical protein